jgi:hypothetical protein
MHPPAIFEIGTAHEEACDNAVGNALACCPAQLCNREQIEQYRVRVARPQTQRSLVECSKQELSENFTLPKRHEIYLKRLIFSAIF